MWKKCIFLIYGNRSFRGDDSRDGIQYCNKFYDCQGEPQEELAGIIKNTCSTLCELRLKYHLRQSIVLAWSTDWLFCHWLKGRRIQLTFEWDSKNIVKNLPLNEFPIKFGLLCIAQNNFWGWWWEKSVQELYMDYYYCCRRHYYWQACNLNWRRK